MERRFDINPHVIRQLGEELVPDEMTALMELIKNAYDADASFVKIDINTTGVYSGESLTYQSHTGYISRCWEGWEIYGCTPNDKQVIMPIAEQYNGWLHEGLSEDEY